MKKIADELQTLVDRIVERRVKDITGNIHEYKNFINDFKDAIDDIERDGRSLMEEMKGDKLALGQAEGEGFVRGVLAVKSRLVEDLKYINDL